MNGPSITDWITAWSAVVTALATVVLAIGVALAWRQATKTLAAMGAANASSKAASDAAAVASAAQTRAAEAAEASSAAQQAANEQAAQDSIRRTRPYVFVEFVVGLSGSTSVDLRVANAGVSKASELTIDVEEWPEEMDNIARAVKAMSGNSHTLPPGRSFRVLWSLGTRDGELLTDPETGNQTKSAGMPNQARITVRYQDDDRAVYEDFYALDRDGAGFTPVPNTGPRSGKTQPTPRDMMHLGEAAVRYLGELGR